MSYEWMNLAACAGHEKPELWDVGRSSSRSKTPAERAQLKASTDEALSICASCLVREECGSFGAADPNKYPADLVYGGKIPKRRAVRFRSYGPRSDDFPWARVEALAAAGGTYDSIAEDLGMLASTLWARIKAQGSAELRAQLRQTGERVRQANAMATRTRKSAMRRSAA